MHSINLGFIVCIILDVFHTYPLVYPQDENGTVPVSVEFDSSADLFPGVYPSCGNSGFHVSDLRYASNKNGVDEPSDVGLWLSKLAYGHSNCVRVLYT